ncbi:MAG: hypothetical protein LBS55_11175 [Prevotellaceae bacterium]|jgi:hypothetical protein|nr:hypothetical protein [Prevotellaceae bacterium]
MNNSNNKWRNVESIMDSMSDNTVKDQISTVLAQKHDKANVRVLKKEAKSCHDNTIKNIRYFDIQDQRYWFIMLVLVLTFFIVETCITLVQSDETKDLPFINWLIISSLIFGILLFVASCTYIYHILFSENIKQGFLSWIVIGSAFAIFIQHFILVCCSGFVKSPFMPCLFFLALTILGLPREGGRKCNRINIMSIVIVILILSLSISYFCENNFNCQLSLAFSNIMTFIIFFISSLIIIILRIIGSKRIKL